MTRSVAAAERTARALPYARSWRDLAIAGGFVVLYLLLDRLSYLETIHGIDITPWNPQRGLALAMLIVGGVTYAPLVVLAGLLSSVLLPPVAVPLPAGFIAAVIVAAGYAGAAGVLRSSLRIDPRLHHPRDMVLLIGVTVAAAAAVAAGLVAVYSGFGLIPSDQSTDAALQIWIGDAIGAIVVAPLVLVTLDQPPGWWMRRWPTARAFETLAQWAAIAGALALVVGYHEYRAELFYVLFIPLVWIAARRGLIGASWAVLSIQAGLIGALEYANGSGSAIRTFQLVMFAVATTGLMLGAYVTARQRAADALAASQSRLATILGAARDGVLTVDGAGRIESVNPSVERLFSRPADLLIGRDARDIIDLPRLPAELAATLRLPPDSVAHWELNARHPDGSLFPIEVTVGPFGPGGQERYTLVIRDITRRVDAEVRARAHQSQLARVSRLSLAGEMASALAHELNQPLAAIAAYARGCFRLLRQPEPTKLEEGIQQIVEQAERAADVISRIREFVRSGSVDAAVVAVSDLIEGALAVVAVEARQSGIAIETLVPEDLPNVRADRIQIEQVILNLVRNAMDSVTAARSRPALVTVEAHALTDGMVEILISDTGGGIPDEVAERLFHPFVTTKPGGMGLGLAISRSIVEAHGGELSLVRCSDAGATFAFSLATADRDAS